MKVCSGGVLLSREASLAVPSALKSLTSGFGMGPGVSPSLWPPGTLSSCTAAGRNSGATQWTRTPVVTGYMKCLQGQALGLLVPVSCAPCGVCTSGLSTQSSGWGPYHLGGCGRPHLEAGFPLRCFQRLSAPDVANQPCPWRDNWHTRGPSVPVLSYWGQLLASLLRAQRIGTELSHDVLNPARVPL